MSGSGSSTPIVVQTRASSSSSASSSKPKSLALSIINSLARCASIMVLSPRFDGTNNRGEAKCQ